MLLSLMVVFLFIMPLPFTEASANFVSDERIELCHLPIGSILHEFHTPLFLTPSLLRKDSSLFEAHTASVLQVTRLETPVLTAGLVQRPHLFFPRSFPD